MIRKHSLPFGWGSPAVGNVAAGTGELRVSLGCSCGDNVKGCRAGEARGVHVPPCRGQLLPGLLSYLAETSVSFRKSQLC